VRRTAAGSHAQKNRPDQAQDSGLGGRPRGQLAGCITNSNEPGPPASASSESRVPVGAKCSCASSGPKVDWARELEALLRTRYAHAEKAILVCDNLNTHTQGAFFEAFPPDQARAILHNACIAEVFLHRGKSTASACPLIPCGTESRHAIMQSMRSMHATLPANTLASFADCLSHQLPKSRAGDPATSR